jgi:hypothetical protein
MALMVFFWVFIFSIHLLSQTQKEYIYMDGRLIAVESGDPTPPAANISSPTTGSTYTTTSGTITLGGSASDNVGVTQVTWANSRGGSGTCSGTASWTCSNIALQSGQNALTVTARDAAGNSGTDALTVTYTPPDTAAPTITITSPTSNPTYSTASGSITLGGSASDNVGVTQVTWTNNRGGSGTCSGTASWTCSNITLQSGENALTVTARDAAGNSGTDTLAVAFTPPDTVAPTITITFPTLNPTYSTTSGPITLNGSASDNVGVTQVTWANSRGGSGTCSGTTSWTCSNITLQSGQNALTVTARDAAGNSGTDALTVTRLSQPTSLSFSAASGFAGISSYVVTIGNGANMAVDVKYNYKPWGSSTITYNLTGPLGTMNAQGQLTRTLSQGDTPAEYTFTGIKNSLNADWVSIAPVVYTVRPPKPASLNLIPTIVGCPHTAVTFSAGNMQNQTIVIDTSWYYPWPLPPGVTPPSGTMPITLPMNASGQNTTMIDNPFSYSFIRARNTLDTASDAWTAVSGSLLVQKCN